VGVYIYQWEEKDYGAGRVLCRPRLCRTPSRLHKLECIVLQHRNHFRLGEELPGSDELPW
jgi:hypothetical protein